jgi:hypothetical protein
MKLSFDDLCPYLATKGGGYTLWVGAGASIAATKGATLGWNDLVENLAVARDIELPRSEDMPGQLEVLSNKLGHAMFRKELRARLVTPITIDQLDFDVLIQQAIIGARASAVVSFNIESITAMAFTFGRPGARTLPRTYLDHHDQVGLLPATDPGPLAPPAYAPHGLLDVYGNCVMTKSEYLKHKMSLAVGTAVQFCLGGDLLILGMSMSDGYLQEALIANRRWIKDIYWITGKCEHPEWARVADVTVVQADHSRVWKGIAGSHVDAGPVGDWSQIQDSLSTQLKPPLATFLETVHGMQARLDDAGALLVADKRYGADAVSQFARRCEDLGLEVPQVIKEDSRYRGSP